LETYKDHKKGLLQQLFPAEGETVPGLRFPEFLDAGGWEVKPLGEAGKNLDSKRMPITEKDRIKGDIPYYGASGVIDYIKDFIFDEELLCISEDGANLVVRTYPIAFSIAGKAWVNNHAHVLKFEYAFTQVIVENYLNAMNLEDYLTGMAQPKLNRANLDIIPIPLPSLPEQQKIADCLSSLDELITAQAQKVESLKTHKKGLMQGLFPSADEVGM
ncbi:MAG: restriction endonuclease subunit S, partial [Thermodesulfobacteriota bacterium]|nr:restriction endonuclease subunit S [Thermodesulfobacteriota bacterium]